MDHIAHRPTSCGGLARRGVAFAVGFLALALLLIVAQGRASAAQTVVSLQFDDGVISQNQVRPVLTAHGMDATFFINSGVVGDEDHMTWADVHALADDGNEIGGHTLTHPHLTQLTTAEATTEICQDRANLQAQGFTVTNFAYPFGDFNATTQGIVDGCGYDTGRGVSGIVSPNGCFSCDFAESIPPANRLATRTPQNPQETTTLADLQGYVTQAEQHGGGWVQVVFHEICDGCDQYSTPLSEFTAFVDWLQAREGSGTVVKTVAEVMELPPPPPPPAESNLLQNPSLEADTNNDQVPDCWLLGGFGTNTFSWARVTDAHTGGFAERSTITAYTDGDRKLVSRQDTGTCAPAAIPGHHYNVGAYYKFTASARLVVYTRAADGTWNFLAQGTLLPPAADYAPMSMTTPAIPAGATHLSIGISLREVGTVTGDDYYLGDADSAADYTAPTASVTAPAAGATLSGSATLTADAADNQGVSRVDFLVDDQIVGSDTSAPFTTTFNSSTLADGPHTVRARAVDTGSNSGTSGAVAVAVDNSAAPPPEFNLLQNPSLETDANNDQVPDCWQLGGSGNNTFSWARVTDARTGGFAERSTITAYTDGDRRLLSRQDAGPCAPAAVPGHHYLVRAYYKSTASVRLVTYYRSAAGVWTFFAQGAVLPASAGYAPMSLTTPAVPAGATHLSIGISLREVGSVTGDDYYLGDADADHSAPTVTLTAPAAGATVTGTAALTATATDTGGVDHVDFLVDDQVVATDASAPYEAALDTTTLTEGLHTVRARAVDTSANATLGDQVTVAVDNTAPGVSLTAPAAGALLRGSATLSATATDTVGVDHVDFLVDDQVVATDASAPYEASLDTASMSDGSHAVRARAADGAGHTTLGDPVTVSVDNAAPTVTLTAPAGGATLAGSAVALSADASDNVAVDHVDFLVDGQVVATDASEPYSATLDSTTLSDGSRAVRARATDTAGNTTLGDPVTVTVDNDAPTVTLTAPAAGATLAGTVTMSATATDAVGVDHVDFLVDDQVVATDASAPYSAPLNTTTLTAGGHAIRARAVDTGGHATLGASVSVTVNNAPPAPTVALTAPAAGALLRGSVTLTATASGSPAVQRVEFLMDGIVLGTDTSSPYSYAWNTATRPDGAHSLQARAVNTAGTATLSAARSVTVDNTAPASTIQCGGVACSTGWYKAAVSVTLSATDGSGSGVSAIRYTVNGTNPSTSSPAYTGPISITQTTTIRYRAYDAAGNAEAVRSQQVRIDTVKPTVSILTPSNGSTVRNTVTIWALPSDSGGSGVASVSFYRDSGVLIGTDTTSLYTVSWATASLTKVNHTIYAVATDAAGNSTTSTVITVRVA